MWGWVRPLTPHCADSGRIAQTAAALRRQRPQPSCRTEVDQFRVCSESVFVGDGCASLMTRITINPISPQTTTYKVNGHLINLNNTL
jgi:hypothetical protein